MYYKDDTHYFVMTAKKQCLLRLGVLLQVGPGPREDKAGGIQSTPSSPASVQAVTGP